MNGKFNELKKQNLVCKPSKRRGSNIREENSKNRRITNAKNKTKTSRTECNDLELKKKTAN